MLELLENIAPYIYTFLALSLLVSGAVVAACMRSSQVSRKNENDDEFSEASQKNPLRKQSGTQLKALEATPASTSAKAANGRHH
jgi:hypothetical protein